MPSPAMMSATPSPRRFNCLAPAQCQGAPDRSAQDAQRNQHFVNLLNAFRRSGGLARVPEVAARFHTYGNDVSPLAGWINQRQVISFEWQSQIWIPLFQFNRATMALHEGLIEVRSALAQAFAPWQQAVWFSQPNHALGDRVPAQVLVLDCEAVAMAARANPPVLG